MNTFSLKQLIDDPTRITVNCKSILDLILVSDHEIFSQSGVWPYGNSNHIAIYCTRKVKRPDIKKHHTSQIRSMKNYSAEALNSKLNKLNWFEILNLETANEAWLKFKQIFTIVINELAPLKSVRLKQRSQSWFIGVILDTIQKRDKALYKF